MPDQSDCLDQDRKLRRKLKEKVLEAAFGGENHDMGKLGQRTHIRSDLSEAEKEVTPFNKKGGFYSHLHAGYTSRFMKEELGLFNEFEREVS